MRTEPWEPTQAEVVVVVEVESVSVVLVLSNRFGVVAVFAGDAFAIDLEVPIKVNRIAIRKKKFKAGTKG